MGTGVSQGYLHAKDIKMQPLRGNVFINLMIKFKAKYLLIGNRYSVIGIS